MKEIVELKNKYKICRCCTEKGVHYDKTGHSGNWLCNKDKKDQDRINKEMGPMVNKMFTAALTQEAERQQKQKQKS